MKNDCVFCAIAAGEIPSFKVYEDDETLAYLDINPFSRGHTLVIPKRHTVGLLDTDDDALAFTNQPGDMEKLKALAEQIRA